MAAKQEDFLSKFHLRTPSVPYELNVEERDLLFLVPDSPNVTAGIEVAGSFSVVEGTWLWRSK